MSQSLLIIDDEIVLRKALERFFKGLGYDVAAFGDWEKGLAVLSEKRFDVLLVDLMLPQTSGLEVMKKCQKIQPHLAVVVMTGFGTIPSAVQAIREGAYHYVTKPFDLEDLSSLINKALDHTRLKEENLLLKCQLHEKYGFENIIGESAVMQEVFQLIVKIANTDSTLLIMGESGTGKELLAKAVHFRSGRADKPFIAVNCAAIPEGLLESELFGHMRGAFTGAVTTQAGKFELADQGTIFLDEIGDMSPLLQVKVLRVLQERHFVPVGASKNKEVNIRIITATHQDLTRAVQEGRFREDLYYRLNVIPITLPPLRERHEDIPLLAEHFLKKHNRENKKHISGFDQKVLRVLCDYPWPGNVRELENLIERLVVLKGDGEIQVEDLPSHLRQNDVVHNFDYLPIPESGVNLNGMIDHLETSLIRRALNKSEGNKNKAAQLLKLNRTTLIEKMKKMNL